MSISGKTAFVLVALVMVLAVSASVSAQNHNDWQQAGSGYGGGVYGTGVYVAPAATLPAQNAGISLSNTAGISLTAPLQTGVTTAEPATSGWANGVPGYASGYGYGAPGYNAVVPAATVGEGNGGETGRLINDLGPSYYAGAYPGAEVAAPSLAEIAAQYKGGHSVGRQQNARMYTNADADKMLARVKTGTGGTQPVALESVGAQTTQASPAPATQPAQDYGKHQQVESQTAQSANQSAGPTTPQINPPAQNSEQEEESLPATATLLPFLTFLGLLSGVAGLWLIKFRK